ncbi:helix-turn-helix domain-containing protein [Paracidovorax citrulli]|uniref:helix-turn-helix domain-containing protein n=1 Tax=Paracidovorax citrulli TaxID=80869 RepID=UPI001D18EE41|nr:helix-turn-helix transcriptional regulator [Paracidovorax citrulli]UEG45287.1 helix-turn-helix domain-containing protein [Paracidovorax citrulli]
MYVESLFLRFKEVRGISYDADVAKELEVERAALSNYKKGKRRLPDRAMVKLAEGLGFTLEEVVAAVNLEFEKTPADEKEFWAKRVVGDRPLNITFENGRPKVNKLTEAQRKEVPKS